MEGGSNSNPSSAAWSAPQLPTDQKIRRMKLYWRAALISNFVLGGQHPPPQKTTPILLSFFLALALLISVRACIINARLHYCWICSVKWWLRGFMKMLCVERLKPSFFIFFPRILELLFYLGSSSFLTILHFYTSMHFVQDSVLGGDRLKWGLRHVPFGPRRLEEREVGILALGEWLPMFCLI